MFYSKEVNDLVYFTTRVSDTSDTSATRMIRVQHEYNTNNTSAIRVSQKGGTSATQMTRVQILILITTRMKTYYKKYTPTLAI